MSKTENSNWLDEIKWGPDGLVPAIAQDSDSGKVLTLAWMNRESLSLTIKSGRATYWSRSKQRLWQKGEASGHIQNIKEVYLDCDKDAVVLSVKQLGGIACHTGRESCFFHRYENGAWIVSSPVIKDPKEIYQQD